MYRYKIMMKTQMGRKYGELIFLTEGEVLSGSLNILAYRNPFYGGTIRHGKCRFTGEMVTPVRNIAFTAEGMADESSVELDVYTDGGILHITGRKEN